jgi:two-component system, cell cycle sensor histidine kinase and response regulator CckA
MVRTPGPDPPIPSPDGNVEHHALAFLENPFPILIVELESGRLIDVNPAFERAFGWQRHEAVGRTSVEIGLFRSPQIRSGLVERLRARGRIHQEEVELLDRDGVAREFLVSAVVFGDAGLRLHLAVLEDVTERRRAERERQRTERSLLEAQRMESVGRLAGGVSHDFNNLLSVIVGNAELLESGLAPDDPARDLVREILDAAGRGSGLTRKLLAFDRLQVVEPRLLSLDVVVRELERMLRRVLGEDIYLDVECELGLGRVMADPGQVEQALMNLVVNARDAMPDGGRMSIRVDSTRVEGRLSCCSEPVAAGPYVRIAVADVGEGMSPEVIGRAFEPFFTTKEAGKGTGLGLAAVRDIVHQYGGHVVVESAPGRGTTVSILLPRADGESAASDARPAPVAARGRTVLLVEDEPSVRDLTRRLLGLLGFRVLVASHGAEALERAAAEPGTIDLLLTDVVMPGLSGPELARELSRRRVGLRTLFISGYAHDAPALREVLASGGRLLAKPFGREELDRTLREVLDAPPPG